LDTTSDKHSNSRKIEKNLQTGEVTIYNSLAHASGNGSGTKVFTRQVAAAQKIGATRIVTSAARSSSYNGYITWAKLGYDGKIPWSAIGRSVKDEDRATLEKFNHLTKVSELMATREGAKFLEKHGGSWSGEFDLREGSYSMNTLREYLATRGLL
jgi:hypothetical protein